ncbi:uncharacterized protein isoform X3 [Salmo salar]|uniref:Uncharacterized protein isoform X3 n=1 Tax=Salmo salar TaxID=8030 RepID=A0A1S3Q7Q0_SALSA|nr:uncharacterized protein LOC106590009 isoform X3 [Salmo salar]
MTKSPSTSARCRSIRKISISGSPEEEDSSWRRQEDSEHKVVVEEEDGSWRRQEDSEHKVVVEEEDGSWRRQEDSEHKVVVEGGGRLLEETGGLRAQGGR